MSPDALTKAINDMVTAKTKIATDYSNANPPQIDSLSNIKNSPVFIHSGSNDNSMPPPN